MPTLTMTKGLPASGKSTWAKEQVAQSNGQTKRVNKDDLRHMLDSGVWNKENEKHILKVRDKLVVHYLSNGFSVIVDDTNLHPKHEKTLRELAEGFGVTFEVKSFLDVSLHECIQRDIKRGNKVGKKAIERMYNQFLNQKRHVAQYMPPVKNPDLPDCIIVDIDGTLAHMTDRSPYDYTKVNTDVVDEAVRDIVRIVHWFGDQWDPTYVVIVSGRDDTCKEATEMWLADNDIPYDELYMRDHTRVDEQGRKLDDTITKKDIYEKFIKPRFNVRFVLDDRDRVVKMWREEGLKVLQVAEGDF